MIVISDEHTMKCIIDRITVKELFVPRDIDAEGRDRRTELMYFIYRQMNILWKDLLHLMLRHQCTIQSHLPVEREWLQLMIL